MKNTIKILIIAIVIIAAIAGYEAFQLDLSLKQNKVLTTQLDKILKEKEQVQSQLKEAGDVVNPLKEENANLKKSLTEKEEQLIQLKSESYQPQYNEQKLRLTRLIDVLAQKDLELKQRQKEISALKAKKIVTKKDATKEYTIGEGDVLYITVWKEEEDLDQEVIVRPDGRVSFSLAGDVPAVGLTFTQLKEELTQRLKNYIKHPVVSISLRKLGGNKIIVMGEVGRPGVYSVTGKRTVLKAIAQAGGFTQDAVARSVILIRGGLQDPKGKRLNLTRAIKKGDASQNVVLYTEDIVYVPKRFIANLNYALTQILGPLTHGATIISHIEDFGGQ